ncbi:MAG TPA: M4 family metallopeptidase, partial [Chthoniobacterales bacterium]|nr:M4 family metallopeptidase [Chthoniobacterales bacterium]
MKTTRLTKTRVVLSLALCAAGAALTALSFNAGAQTRAAKAQPAAQVTAPPAAPAAVQALTTLQRNSGTQARAQVNHATGVYDFVRAEGGNLLARDNVQAGPEERARAFLAAHGGVVGMSTAERNVVANANVDAALVAASALHVANVATDQIGLTHVKFTQSYRGLRVFGAELIVHMNDRGITAVNGTFITDLALDITPALTAEAAGQDALVLSRKSVADASAQLTIIESELAIFRTGLLEGYQGRNVLAYGVKIADAQGPLEQVWLSATNGTELLRVPLRQEHHKNLHRTVYSPRYDSSNPSLHVVRDEDDLIPSPVPQIEGLFVFSGQTYNLFHSAFGRSSYDGMSAQMRTVYLVNSICPNAYWDGATTNYCPEVDGDDVVAHEWGHGYTQFTHNLVYSFQSGALNESYSDIWGEVVDIHNNMDGEGGNNNAAPAPAGQRWLIGEDVAGLGPLRDMWNPPSHSNPDKVSSPVYHCAPSDGGGVHTNSGVPNHAFAMIVDGKTFNNQTVTGLGFTKAIHIYFRAMSVYQHSTTNFPHHAESLLTACNDLATAGTNLNGFSLTSATGTPSGQVITTADCDQVGKAIAAVEMQTRPVQCNFGPLLDPNVPPDCQAPRDVFTEDWETGMDGWTLLSEGEFAGWPDFNWELKNTLPGNR